MVHSIQLTKTYRYFTHGNLDTAKTIWFVLHGYGQLPEYFIRKFQHLHPEDHFIVAPEGMHRFYLNGTSGRVGASWMTKEARLQDIEDNIRFLNSLADQFSAKNAQAKKVLLGFSQGGATAARWHELGNWQANEFILWASVFPPDLELPRHNSHFSASNNLFLVGTKDEYFSTEKTAEITKHLKNAPLNFKCYSYSGNHSVDPIEIELLAKKL